MDPVGTDMNTQRPVRYIRSRPRGAVFAAPRSLALSLESALKAVAIISNLERVLSAQKKTNKRARELGERWNR